MYELSSLLKAVTASEVRAPAVLCARNRGCPTRARTGGRSKVLYRAHSLLHARAVLHSARSVRRVGVRAASRVGLLGAAARSPRCWRVQVAAVSLLCGPALRAAPGCGLPGHRLLRSPCRKGSTGSPPGCQAGHWQRFSCAVPSATLCSNRSFERTCPRRLCRLRPAAQLKR